MFLRNISISSHDGMGGGLAPFKLETFFDSVKNQIAYKINGGVNAPLIGNADIYLSSDTSD